MVELWLAVHVGGVSVSTGKKMLVNLDDSNLTLSGELANSLCEGGFSQPNWVDRPELVQKLASFNRAVMNRRTENRFPITDCGQETIFLFVEGT